MPTCESSACLPQNFFVTVFEVAKEVACIAGIKQLRGRWKADVRRQTSSSHFLPLYSPCPFPVYVCRLSKKICEEFVTKDKHVLWFLCREEPNESFMQQHSGSIVRWLEERRSRHEVWTITIKFKFSLPGEHLQKSDTQKGQCEEKASLKACFPWKSFQTLLHRGTLPIFFQPGKKNFFLMCSDRGTVGASYIN